MVELYIDGEAIVTAEEPKVNLSFDAATTRTIEAAREAQYLEVVVEVKDNETTIFGSEGYLHCVQRFNAVQHTGEVLSEGVVLFDGDITISSIAHSGESMSVTLMIKRSGAEWAQDAADTMLNDTDIDYTITLNSGIIKSRWESSDYPVQFVPVHRDEYSSVQSSDSLERTRVVLAIDDYHPFLNVRAIFDAIVKPSGYEIVSQLLDSDEFKSLYISGNYASQENDVVTEVMDFYVKNLTDKSTTGDSRGRVSIGPYVAYNSISGLVDIGSLDSDNECFTRSNCLSLVDSVIQFTPTTSVCVGFEYHLIYTTGYTIESRTRLKAFDTFYFGESPLVEVEIVNTFEDERDNDIARSFEYRVVAFGGDDSASYRLQGVTNLSSTIELATWSGNTTTLTTPSYVDIESLELQVYADGSYVTYEDDWALYQGYISYEGVTDVDVVVRTSPISISPTSPKKFDVYYVEGGSSGMQFTLREGTSISPYFSAYPGYGAEVEFYDVAQHQIQQSEFVESIQHLFNLRYYTDRVAKKLYIDPLEWIYNRDGEVLDWSDRLVESEPIVFEDVAMGVAQSRTWGYQSADGITYRSQGDLYLPGDTDPLSPETYPTQIDYRSYSPEFGAWTKVIDSYAADDTTLSLLNPIFSPTFSDTEGLLIVGDRDDPLTTGSLEFSPRIVRWCGSVEYNYEMIPKMLFFDSAADVNLCFEDRDFVAGLNSYYTKQIDREQSGQYVTLSLKVSAFEAAALFDVNEHMASLLSHFKLLIDYEWAECRIEQILSYDIEGGVMRCKLLIVN